MKLERIKEWIRNHLESEAKMVTEVINMYLNGELKYEDFIELNRFIKEIAKELMSKYPVYRAGILNANNVMKAFIKEILDAEEKGA